MTTARQIESRLAAERDRSTPALRALRRAISRELKASSGLDVLRTVESLVHGGRIPRWFAYELAHHHRDAMARLTASRLERLGKGLSAWHEVDPFASYLSGPAWRQGQVKDSRVHAWSRSRNRWWRRTAVVSTVALNTAARGGTGDARRTLGVCDLVLDDRDDMVVKALSWALRALAQREPAIVAEYLDANRERLAARVLREVENKLSTGLKNPSRSRRTGSGA